MIANGLWYQAVSDQMKIAPAAEGAVVCLGALVAQGLKVGATVELGEGVTIMATREVTEHTGLHTLVCLELHPSTSGQLIIMHGMQVVSKLVHTRILIPSTHWSSGYIDTE